MIENLRFQRRNSSLFVTGGSSGGSFRKRDELHTAQKKIKELEKENVESNAARQSLQIEREQIGECMDEVNDPDEANQPLVERVRDVLHKLQSAEMMCEDLLDENEDLKKELRSLEAEMDELHDNFRQDQAMEFQTIQKELELTMKNCRILQFKLRKSERKCDEVESDKMLYEVKLRQLTNVSSGSSLDSGQLREMANELQQTKEVNKRLQEEIEHIEEERNAIKSSYDILAKTCMDLEKQKENYRNQAEKLKPEVCMHLPFSSIDFLIEQFHKTKQRYRKS
jgi:chromosome segregation ATPase